MARLPTEHQDVKEAGSCCGWLGVPSTLDYIVKLEVDVGTPRAAALADHNTHRPQVASELLPRPEAYVHRLLVPALIVT